MSNKSMFEVLGVYELVMARFPYGIHINIRFYRIVGFLRGPDIRPIEYTVHTQYWPTSFQQTETFYIPGRQERM